jgi:hypothetical protein
MLYFEKDQVLPLKAASAPQCSICKDRKAPWKTNLRTGKAEPVCGWCLLYSNETEWGYANRDEVALIGKGAVATAANSGRNLPVLDQRHRLSSVDAEKFVTGIFATSRSLRGPLRRMGRILK